MRRRKPETSLLAMTLAVAAMACHASSTPCDDGKCKTAARAVTADSLGPAQVLAPVGYAVSPPVADLPPAQTKPEGEPEEEEKEREEDARAFRTEDVSTAPDDDAVVQNLSVEPTLAEPDVSFDGLSNTDNGVSFGFTVFPPDTNGDVGPNHYVQMTNLLVRVFNKAGTPLTPAFRLSSLWQNLGGQCAAQDNGDPVVVYDPLADRWVLSQFAFASTSAPPFHECIAVSQTPDPTGAWFLYDFVTPGANFPDYPKLAVWNNAYFMTTNQFLNGASFNGAGVFAFDRNKMLAGDPSAAMVYFDLNITRFPEQIGGMLAADLDGLTPPPAGAPGVFAYFVANEFGAPADGLRVFDFRADFANPAASTFTERAESPIVVAPFNPLTPSGRDDIIQPPPAPATAALDSISDRLMHRLAYRNFGDHESLVVNHSVNVGTGTTTSTYRSGVRYYELRRAGAGAFAVAEQATFAPDSNHRWMGSAAQDHQGNLAVGYTAAGTALRPSLRYAGRLATDPPGGLFQGERTLVTSTGVQTNTGSRWGDYSSLNVDPADDCTFWYTSEYYTAASQASSSIGWLTRVGRFRFPECAAAVPAVLQGSVTNARTGAPIAGATVGTADGFLRYTGATGAYSMNMAARTYTVTASAFGYRPATVSVAVGAGTTTTQNFALTPVPVLRAAGATISRESCSINGAIDPTEEVRVKLALQNIGGVDADRVEATLLATGGVTRPSNREQYGRIPAGGAAVEREFRFTAAAACGGTLTATLQLRDSRSGESLGTVAYPFTIGTLSPVATSAESSSGNLTTPIPDLTTVTVPFDIADAGQVVDVDVRVRLNHTFDGDVNLTLISPDGTSVDLSSGNGGGGDNFGSGAADCSGTPTVFDDDAPASIVGATAPFAGRFRPEQALSRFAGKSLRGTWKVQVSDTASIDTGTLFCVQLVIARKSQICCDPNGTPTILADASALVYERFTPANGAADPGERVTYQLSVRNIGTGNSKHLVGQLQPGNGVLLLTGDDEEHEAEGHEDSDGGGVFGVVHTGGAPVGRDFRFVADGTCGATIRPTLALHDGTLDLGQVAFPIRLGTTEVRTASAANATPIAINDSPRTSGIAVASPYPSAIDVSGLTGTIRKVTVALSGFAHTFPSDVDILLVGPQGQQVTLVSDAGGSTRVTGINLVLDDAAAGAVPSPLVSGTFKPTNLGGGDTYPGAPPGAPASALAVFNGTDPNGAWRLFVVDDAATDRGDLTGGWSLTIETEAPVCVAPPPPGGDDDHDGD